VRDSREPDLLRPTRELFCQWSRCLEGAISRAELNGNLAGLFFDGSPSKKSGKRALAR
jgi:hypothetical protein